MNYYCISCRRNINKPRYFVRMNTHSEPVNKDWVDENDMGFYPIGSCCAKKERYKLFIVDTNRPINE